MRNNAAKVIPVSSAGGDGGGDDMETRVTKLETAVSTMQQDIAIIKATCATKSELSDLKTELKGDMYKLREELKEDIHTLREELKGDIHTLREELKDVQVIFFKAIASQTKWLAATVIAASVMIITVLPIILHFTK